MMNGLSTQHTYLVLTPGRVEPGYDSVFRCLSVPDYLTSKQKQGRLIVKHYWWLNHSIVVNFPERYLTFKHFTLAL